MSSEGIDEMLSEAVRELMTEDGQSVPLTFLCTDNGTDGNTRYVTFCPEKYSFDKIS